MFQKKKKAEGESREQRSKLGKNEFNEARRIAMGMLGVSARSRSEIEKRLQHDDFDSEDIELVLVELEALDLLDDDKFAQAWVDDRADRKGYGKTRLAQELKGKGVDKETIQDALGTIEEDAEIANCLSAARTKWKPEKVELMNRAALTKEKTRVSNFLQRRGFSWHIITKVLAILAENND